VERWWNDCGCNSGSHPGWSQAWRTPLRNALDWLRDTLAPRYEARARELLKDPWEARNDYIRVMLDRSPEKVGQFLADHAARELSDDDQRLVLRLLEIQRHAMLMYTSCGWFFDDLSGIETVQIMQYAGRALQLAQEVGEDDLEPRFLELLAQAHSNLADQGDGRRIYEKYVRPAMVDLLQVGAHYAISSLFEDYPPESRIFCYSVQQQDYRLSEVGKAKLAVGQIAVTSEISWKSADLSFGVLHFGDHNLCGGVREYQGQEAYDAMAWEVTEAFSWGEFPETIRRIDQHFGASTYSLRTLFRDEQRQVLDQILDSTLEGTWSTYRRIYNDQVPLMRFLTDMGVPLPNAFRATAEFVLNLNLRQAFEAEEPDLEEVYRFLEEARLLEIGLNADYLEYPLRKTMERLAGRFTEHPNDIDYLRQLEAMAELAQALPFEVNLWKVQNYYYEMSQTTYPAWRRQAEQGRAEAQTWVTHFVSLGAKLQVHVD
jgi:hypothetical protein